MKLYEKMNAAIYCDDLLQCADLLIDFAQAALLEKNKGTVVKHFYERLYRYSLGDIAFDSILKTNNKQYFIYDIYDQKPAAINKYIALVIPAKESPVKTLWAILSFGEQILADFTKPKGINIKKEKLVEIMDYLDLQYAFSQKIFADRKALFLILNYSRKNCNSECLITQSGDEIIQHFFLYCIANKHKGAITPEAVLFHELGHAMHARYTGDIMLLPKNIIHRLEKLCMPEIGNLTAEEQTEVLADVLSVGLMYESPFSEYDAFSYMHPDDKREFKLMCEQILSEL
jgi:hypothetical protein